MLGSGTKEDPYQITDAIELQAIKDILEHIHYNSGYEPLVVGIEYKIITYKTDDDFMNVGASSNATGVIFVATGTTPTHWQHASILTQTTYYILINDIDASDTINWNGGTGFIPIGTEDGTPSGDNSLSFSGNFDGKGFTISNLYITKGRLNNLHYSGLFAATHRSAEIYNLNLVSAYVSGGSTVGVLVGVNFGNITCCYVSGYVPANGTWTIRGGLVGHHSYGIIKQCWANVTVNGYSGIGGFVGSNSNMYGEGVGTILNCYSEGVIGQLGSYNYIGGFIGNCYGNISKCYSVGRVYPGAGGNNGGFCGKLNAGTISYCYYDTETSFQSDTGKGIPKTTVEMMQQATFETWDFDTIWKIQETFDYPKLQCEVSISAFTPKIIMIM